MPQIVICGMNALAARSLGATNAPTAFVPLFVAAAERTCANGQPWIALGALAADASLDVSAGADKLDESSSSCASGPMCSMLEAANASPTRAPILGLSERRAVCFEDAAQRFPCFRRVSVATSTVSV